jgi:hypothetical protein
MHTRHAALGTTDVQLAGGEVDIVPTQRHQLTRPQAVAVGDQDGSSVPMAPAIFPGRLDQPLDLALGEILPRPGGSDYYNLCRRSLDPDVRICHVFCLPDCQIVTVIA